VYVPDFDYYCPDSIKEACEMLVRFGSKAKVIAGGTDLLGKMKQDLLTPEVIISLKNIRELATIQDVEGKGVVLGAMVTHNDLVGSSVLQRRYPSVSEAAHTLANNQVRNRGTIGGNIVNAVPSADLPPILIALSTTVTLVGPGGSRTFPLEQFFTGPGQSVINENEILTEIVIPDQSPTGSSYFKFGLRHSGALAVVGVAAAVTMEDDRVKDARIALGAVAPTPMRAREAERTLIGKGVSEDLLEEAGQHAARECRPISDIRGSEEYRRDMVRVFTKRALRKAVYGNVYENISEENGGPYDADHHG
jgi:carbon-monoxide dehydrogenase medium subunit